MSWLDTKRVIRYGFKSFTRNGVVSAAAVLVTTITLCVIASLIFLQAILNFSLTEIKDKVDVTVYFTPNASEEKILSLKTSLEQLPEVANVDYVSSEKALENFKTRHENDYLTLQALDELGTNPLGASLNIKAQQTSQYESIAKFLEGDNALAKDNLSIIDKINYHQNKLVIDRLTSIVDGAQALGFLVTLLLAGISILITFNTIRLTIFVSREEIGVMRLVGAGNRYIRGPFMVEGIIYGVIASVLTMILFIPLTLYLGRNLSGFLGMDVFQYYLSNFFQILAILLVVGVFLGAISSFLAIRKYLNK